MVHRRSTIGMTALALGAVVALSGCAGAGSGDSDSELTPFTLGLNSWTGYGPWYIAQDQGYFEDAGIDLELLLYNEADYVSLASTGQVDGMNHSINDWLVNVGDHGYELVLLEDVSLTADAMLGSEGVDSVEDLVGGKVAFGYGGVSALVYYDALAKNDIDPAGIETVNLEPADAGNAMIAGQVPAAVTYEPYVSTVLASDPDAKIIYSAGETPGLISDGLFVDPDYAAENPDVVEGLADAWGRSIAFIEENPDEAKDIIGEAIGIPSDQREDMFEGLEFYSLEDSQEMLAPEGAFLTETLPSIQAAMIAAGIIDSEVELSDGAVSTSWVDAALED
ncbi:ABC transporter substrate-binding protein [Rathayibacter sp. VKM Ac-2754]|uniref:ABC transporter substrate-binding protein n=1 Tax=Rathayibacter sp. VKM Ac-2754 TaxID=2609251 RepID=UPI00135A66BE|nr:ABC transporter substrate-binding protein [Rathayibacter sp. VKM Ac-2754]